jgi:hypothetical protein
MTSSWPRARALLLVLALALLALTPLAYASPPDPVWIPGFFDDGDNDDAVFLITSSSAALDPFPLNDSAPTSVHEPALLRDDAEPIACLCLAPSDARASPAA